MARRDDGGWPRFASWRPAILVTLAAAVVARFSANLLAALTSREPVMAGPLDSARAHEVAILHAQGGFSRGWDATECAALLAETSVIADGIVAGGGRLRAFVLSRMAADEAEILSIVVAPGSRGRGLARLLLDQHLGRLERSGVAALLLEVAEDNAAARALYRSLDFREVGRRHGYYPMPDGSRATALVLRRQIG